MTESKYVKDLKRKYTVKVYDAVYCTSTTDYYATAVIIGGGKRDRREVDIRDFRMMWHDAPFTYKGYPSYVLRSIASQLKEKLDNGELSVYEHDRDGNRRYQDLRYHRADYLEQLITMNYEQLAR